MGTLMEFQCFQFQLSASIRIHIRNRKKNIIQIVSDQKKVKRNVDTIKYRHRISQLIDHCSSVKNLQIHAYIVLLRSTFLSQSSGFCLEFSILEF